MAAQSTGTSRQVLLRAQDIRELIRDARGASAPDYVARSLRHGFLEPFEEDAEEVAALLGDLADAARRRVEEEGIEPLHNEKQAPPKLPKRERECVANLALLAATRAGCLMFGGHPDEGLAECIEALAWGRVSQDHHVLSLVWMTLYAIYERLGKWDDQRHAIMRSFDEARASGGTPLIIETMMPLISYLIEAMDLDEAERLIAEAQSILQTEFSEEGRHPHYAVSLSHAARIARYRGREPESIQGFREALRWADGALYPLTRSSILSHLGFTYSHLEQHRQSIECQRELVDLADTIGVNKIKSWAYLNLAGTHQRLEEYEQAMELLDQAERTAAGGSWDHISSIMLKRSEILVAMGRPEEATALCRRIVGNDELPRATRLHGALFMLGRIEEDAGRHQCAEELYREATAAIARDFPGKLSSAHLGIARVLHASGRYDEAIALLDTLSIDEHLSTTQAAVLRLRASIAEAREDLRTVIDCERRAVAIERELIERKAEQSLRSARIMLETDLLEREAELERERRRQLERELANAVVALDDRTRQAAAIEEQLRTILAQTTTGSERAVIAALQEAIRSLGSAKPSQESVHHYLSKVDEDFQHRLRKRFPDLTRKQERLCGLVRAGLDSKEIASLLTLQPEGLKALRKRLRKVLGLEQEETLESFLGGV